MKLTENSGGRKEVHSCHFWKCRKVVRIFEKKHRFLGGGVTEFLRMDIAENPLNMKFEPSPTHPSLPKIRESDYLKTFLEVLVSPFFSFGLDPMVFRVSGG